MATDMPDVVQELQDMIADLDRFSGRINALPETGGTQSIRKNVSATIAATKAELARVENKDATKSGESNDEGEDDAE